MKRAILITTLLILFPLSAVNAFEFNPENIITDFELKDKNSMSEGAIQSFLDDHNSPLKDKWFEVDGKQRSASKIIYDAAREHIISPKFILTKLDQEQCFIRGCSFLNDPTKLQKALDWACGFAVCTGCDLSSARVQKYKGFAKQVDALAGVQNDYIRKAADASYIFQKGQTFTTKDGYTLTPENQATANLYTYTPYQGGSSGIGGNYLFAKLWDKYWGHLLYPDGTVLKDSRNNYWLVDGTVKRRYASSAIYFSFHTPADAASVSDSVLEQYATGSEIKFTNYSLVQDELDNIYLLVDDRKRRIEDEEAFRVLGFNPEEVDRVRSSDLTLYRNAVMITKTSIYPQGTLMKEDGSGRLYWVQNGFKYLVEQEVADLNYPMVQAISVSQEELSKYYNGGDQKIKDGRLVKSVDGEVYLVSRGMLRKIPTANDFINLFGEERWNTISQVSAKVLDLHQAGEPFGSNEYERDIGQVAGDRVQVLTSYKTLWISSGVPRVIVAGGGSPLKVTFKNKSSATWNRDEVFMKLEETGDQIFNSSLVLVGMSYTFSLPADLSASPDQRTFTFKLYNKEGVYVPGGLYQTKAVVIDPPYRASIVSHNLPVAVLNKWSRVNVEIEIKNEGTEPWTRRKTGLQMLSGSGGESQFYDEYDWLDHRTASVSMDPKQDTINPGESSIFKFTVRPQTLPPGFYNFRIKLWMSDKGEIIYLNGGEYFEGVIRVDG